MDEMVVGARRVGGSMFTASGRTVWPLDPRVEEIAIEDVAHHLAMICRFCGAVKEFYSVAQHAVLVMRDVVRHGRPDLAAAALLHDAAEAYLGDVIRPLKAGMHLAAGPAAEVRQFAEVEERLLRVIFEALGTAWPTLEDWDAIHQADNRALVSEQIDLRGCWQSGERLPETIRQAWWHTAKREFLGAWRKVGPGAKDQGPGK